MGRMGRIGHSGQMNNQTQVDSFIMAIRTAAPMLMRHIFADGGCYRFHLILKSRFKSAVAYWTKDRNHVVSKICGAYWDINGEVERNDVDEKAPLTPENHARAALFHFDEMLFCCSKLKKIVNEGYKE